ncbi:hypothetical protein PILCRDRAFT_821276 [Piloderma croceum F 1598]|uniref:GmrSD restriction endonucleases N-terminal domain-containing protein n=1 Tax=Piloderma croceum (strain F 1598) TaxID=765440 RepID=A0A0C3FA10_PILCF|nr:hypothetical protein PILCRDRAFT_821276 [Piloderma croceum F 1598]
MYDSDSDLTEDDGDYRPSISSRSKKTGAAAQKQGGYRIKGVLKVPRPTTYTTQAIYEQIISSDINLEPEYQRDVVWPEAKQVGIIDSIFRNFYIPPVIFAVNQFEDGSETKTCIDGKQRLTSIHRFMDGLICHKDPFTNEKLWYKDVGTSGKGSKKKLLPEKYRRLFANKQIVCIEYQDITDDDEREIFQRVQLGMALTPAEKLQAISGPMPAFIRELNSTYLTEGGLVSETLDWDRSRGGDFRCLSQALQVIDKYSTNASSFGSMSQLEKWLTQSSEPTSEFREKIHNTYSVLRDLAHDKSLNKVFNTPTKMSPIEFIMISVLVAAHKDKLTPSQLSVAIGEMRAHARTEHVDIRMNTRVGKTMMKFIKEFKAGKSQGRDGGESAGSLAKAEKKRKRSEKLNVNEDEDVVMEPPPSPKDVRPPRTVQVPRKNSAPSASEATARSATGTPINGMSDRLAAIRAAKDKLASKSMPLPVVAPPVRQASLNPPTSSTKPKTESNPLESALMTRMNTSLSIASNRAPGPNGSDSSLPQSRHSSPRGRSRDRDKDRDRDRDRGIRGRSISSERSSRTRRPYDGTRDWDYKSHRGRDRQYSGSRKDTRDDHR